MKSWFDNIKWVEMLLSVGFQCLTLFTAQTQAMHVDPKTALAAVGTALPGLVWSYLRNPKPVGWAEAAKVAAPEAAAKLGIRTDRSDEI